MTKSKRPRKPTKKSGKSGSDTTETVRSDDNIEQLPLKTFTEQAYLDYSMYVVLDRALPNIGDGLKPVQRRIIYAMSELGLKAGSKFKKSARTVGDVLGKFHPHGDSACYEAMVLMAQPFSYRYPLLEGQGNWGSPDDPKSFAAMRYTESRLSAFADLLLREVGQGTVDWVPNFDGTLEEPRLLPARVPHILLNGTTGIAVGMATDIPPHNLREVGEACIHLLKNPNATLAELCKFVKGPDYPTEAEIITPRNEIRAMYNKGNGSIRMRAKFEKEDGDIIITALPHQTSPAKILEQIAGQMTAKKLPMVVDLRDESDHENPTRLVIVTKSRVDADELMAHLFATTDLERTYRVNMNVIGLNGRPGVRNLKEMLSEWLEYRLRTVTRRLEYRLGKVNDRLHLLDGLLVAFLNLDEVIRIIRREDEPKPVLMKRFKLTEVQTDYILDTRLRQLARLEEMKIKEEQKELRKEKKEIETILGSKARLKTLVGKELQEDIDQFGDARRSPIVSREAAQAMDETALISSDPITIVLSDKGWVRAAKGHEIDPASLAFKSGDNFLDSCLAKSNQMAVFIDSTGRSYALPGHTLPSARGMGEPLTGRLSPPDGARFCGVVSGASNEDKVLLLSDHGYGFICTIEDMITRNKKGKALMKVPAGALVLPPRIVPDMEHYWVAIATSAGNLLIHHIEEAPVMPKGKGIKLINISAAKLKSREEIVTAMTVLHEEDSIRIYSGKRHKLITPEEMEAYEGERAQRGRKLPQGFRSIERIEPVTNKVEE